MSLITLQFCRSLTEPIYSFVIKAWKKEGFVFSTPSNHAVKMYDAAVSQVELSKLKSLIDGCLIEHPIITYL